MAGDRRKKVLPKHLPIIRELAERGVREVDIARALNMSRDTWFRIRREDERAAEAWEEGRSVEHSALRGKLFDTAVNGRGKESVTAAIFLLKARHNYRDNSQVEVEHNHRVKIAIELPAALSADQYNQIRQVHPKLLKQNAGEDAPTEDDRNRDAE